MAPGSLKPILTIFLPRPQNGPRRLSEGSFGAFSCLGHQMALGGPQKAHLEHSRALATKWPPGCLQKAHFKHFGALATKWPQEAPRRLILSILVPGPPNGPKRLILSIFCIRVATLVDLGAFFGVGSLPYSKLPPFWDWGRYPTRIWSLFGIRVATLIDFGTFFASGSLP